MARIPRHQIDEIRERVDIVEVIGRHVRLTRKGSTHLGLCPFHQEKTPSFNVVATKGIYHCFGCGVGGDVFKFLMQIEGLSFIEAVKELAGVAGVELEERDISPAELQSIRKRATLFDVLNDAAGFYESVLWTRPEGRTAREYLQERKISKDMAKKARMGLAMPGWTALIDNLHQAGYSPQLIAEAGLARKRNQGDGHYDTFRDRLMIPIRDERSRIIAFGGRIMAGDGPKYINSPETRFYQKSHTLYGFDLARAAIQKRDRVFVVEGYFDVLSMQQAGFLETVATCGTALTQEHLKRIRRMTRNVILLMDSDEAGSRAAERSLGLFLEAGLQPWRLELPGAKDPDEFIRESGADAIEKALKLRVPLVEWVVQRKVEASGYSAAGKEALVDELLPILAKLPGGLVSRVAARTGIPEPILHQKIRSAQSTRRPESRKEPELSPPTKLWKPTRDIVHLLWLLVHRYDQVVDLMSYLTPEGLDGNDALRAVVARIVTGEPVAAILNGDVDLGMRKTLLAVVAREQLYTPEEAAIGMCQIFERLREPVRLGRLSVLQRLLEESIREDAPEKQREILEEQKSLLKVKSEIKRSLISGDTQNYCRLAQQESDL